MIRTFHVLGIVLFIGATSAAFGQSKIGVKTGDKFQFNVRSEMEVTEQGEGENTVRAESGGIALLTASRVSKSLIQWNYETPEVRLVRVSSTTGSRLDTTLSGRTQLVTTDTKGNVVTSAASKVSQYAPAIEAMHKNLIKTWFQPGIFRKMHPGDSWDEKHDEKISVGEMGLNLHSVYTIHYVLDGIVDTLGTKALRVHWQAPSVAIDGKRTIGTQVLPIQGDGEHSGTSYFSTIDGLLLASNSQDQIDMRITTGDNASRHVVPMMWRLLTQSIRR